MGGRLQKVALAVAALSACAGARASTEWLPQVSLSPVFLQEHPSPVATAFAPEPLQAQGMRASFVLQSLPWLTLGLEAGRIGADAAHARGSAGPSTRFALAGATVKQRGWSASLFVSYLGPRDSPGDEQLRLRSTSTAGLQFTRKLTKDARLHFDVFNVFDQRASGIDYFAASRHWNGPAEGDNFLFHPAEPRGFRLRLRATF